MDTENKKRLAREHLEHRRLDQAHELYREVCETNPDDADAWHMMSAINGMLGHDREAEMCARKVIALAPGTAAAYNNLGAALIAQDRLEEAEEALETVLGIDPNDPRALNNRGNIRLKSGDNQAAEEFFRKAISIRQDFAEAHNNLGSALLGQQKTEAAAKSIRYALQLAPDYPDALYNLGQAEGQLENFELALNAYSRLLQLQPGNAAAMLGAADTFHSRGDLDQATKLYQSAIRAAPGMASAHVSYATLLQKLNRHTEAIAALDRALELENDRVDALHYRGVSRKALGDADAAAADFRQVLEIDPDFIQARHLLAAMGLASTPDKADSRYVSALFDQYAESFDSHLVEKLEYRTPEILRDLLQPVLGEPRQQLSVLDLGCGTGLCAPIFRPWCSYLEGVDLSAKMVARAEQLGLYDRLAVDEMVRHLSNTETGYDLVLAADVFVYVGKLDDTFRSCAQHMNPGGILAFSVELLKDNDTDYHLHTGGRYAHSTAYIDRLAAESALVIHTCRQVVLRKEKGQPVAGLVYILKKPG